MFVKDNKFDLEKAQIIYGLLSRSPTKGFSFTNFAAPNDFDSN